ncbi:MAG: tRNA threonylcarbamoyladenosine dehydratase [Oscillospiraceae bacterium]|nr:tRNA threonylcarbamoyladenosine dehydratase [Oscillospiraceae bacterium]
MEHPFLREEMILGADALERLRRSHVIVFGIGGVGSYAAEGLARAGVGQLTLVDNDTVGVTNLNRQLCALHSTLGKNKSDVMAQRVLDINPDCRVTSLPALYNEESKERFFAQRYDYIIDAIDLVSCKLSLIAAAKERGIPIVSAMGTGNKLDPTQFQITDISRTSGCHLARVMRKELRARGIQHHTVLYSEELPHTPQALEAPPPGRRSIPASVSWVPSCAGLMLAGYVVQELIKEKTVK